jgi:hypothetical protein
VPIRTTRLVALAAAATISIGGVGGVALAHGGKGGDDRSHHATKAAPRCTVPAGQLLTTEDSRYLRRLDRKLDRRVARGTMTQARADARMAQAATRLSVDRLLAEARIAPVLTLLGIDMDGLKAARRQGIGILAIAREKGVSVDRLVAALKQGRSDARALRLKLCPPRTTTDGGTTTGGTTTGTTTEGTTAPQA